MSTHEQHTAYLLSWYSRAPEEVKIEGRQWYDTQREIIRELARAHNLPLDTVAACVAALSPMTRWTANVAGAIRLLRAWENGEPAPPRNATLFYKNARKAWRILGGANPWEEFLTSPKVLAFWANLTGDENEVTVDTWMLRCAGEENAAKNGCKAALYNRVTYAVRDAAQQVGETPAQFQAIVWVQIRRELSKYDTVREVA
jgi:hypothetical protein